MTNPSGEFERRLSDAAKEAALKNGGYLPSDGPGYNVRHTLFKAGAHYGIGAVIALLDDSRGGLWNPELSDMLRERFQSGQASDGGKENDDG